MGYTPKRQRFTPFFLLNYRIRIGEITRSPYFLRMVGNTD